MDLNKKQEGKREDGKTHLKQLREALGMTQLEFATALGISISPVANCEQGKSELMLSAGSIRKLHLLMLERLGVGVEVLPNSLKAVSNNHSLFVKAS